MVVLLVSLQPPLLFESQDIPITALLKPESRGNVFSPSRPTNRLTFLLKECLISQNTTV